MSLQDFSVFALIIDYAIESAQSKESGRAEDMVKKSLKKPTAILKLYSSKEVYMFKRH